MAYSREQLGAMVREDRVHRAIYVDPAVFEAEMVKVFGKVWFYVGHDSIVPNPGDYYTTEVARQPLVLTRDNDGKIYVLYNRCGHRGAKVLVERQGHARTFTCMYHGWAYRPSGDLAGLPMRNDFPVKTLQESAVGMPRVARVEVYRGFVFASFNENGEPLLDYLGPARCGIDELVDRSPVGEVELTSGCHRYHFRGNWKLQMDNLADMYHPAACHGSTVGADGRQFQRRPGGSGGDAMFFAPNGEAIVAQTGVRGFPKGHSSEASLFDREQSGAGWEEYRSLMVETYGSDRTKEILKNRRHSMTLFPNVDIVMAQTSVRVVRPIAVDFTEVEVWPVRLRGAPSQLSDDLVKYVNISHAAASFIQSDDLEAFERCQQGLQAQAAEWVLMAKGLGDEQPEGEGVMFGPRSSEVGQRMRHYAWRDLMSA